MNSTQKRKLGELFGQVKRVEYVRENTRAELRRPDFSLQTLENMFRKDAAQKISEELVSRGFVSFETTDVGEGLVRRDAATFVVPAWTYYKMMQLLQETGCR